MRFSLTLTFRRNSFVLFVAILPLLFGRASLVDVNPICWRLLRAQGLKNKAKTIVSDGDSFGKKILLYFC